MYRGRKKINKVMKFTIHVSRDSGKLIKYRRHKSTLFHGQSKHFQENLKIKGIKE